MEDGTVVHDLDEGRGKAATRRVHKRVRTGPSATSVTSNSSEVHSDDSHNESARTMQEVGSHASALVQASAETDMHAAERARVQAILDEEMAAFRAEVGGHTELTTLTEEMIREWRIVARGDGEPKKKKESLATKVKQGFKTCPTWLPQRLWAAYQHAIKVANAAMFAAQVVGPLVGSKVDLSVLKLAFMGYTHEDEDDYPYLPMGTGVIDFGALSASSAAATGR